MSIMGKGYDPKVFRVARNMKAEAGREQFMRELPQKVMGTIAFMQGMKDKSRQQKMEDEDRQRAQEQQQAEMEARRSYLSSQGMDPSLAPVFGGNVIGNMESNRQSRADYKTRADAENQANIQAAQAKALGGVTEKGMGLIGGLGSWIGDRLNAPPTAPVDLGGKTYNLPLKSMGDAETYRKLSGGGGAGGGAEINPEVNWRYHTSRMDGQRKELAALPNVTRNPKDGTWTADYGEVDDNGSPRPRRISDAEASRIMSIRGTLENSIRESDASRKGLEAMMGGGQPGGREDSLINSALDAEGIYAPQQDDELSRVRMSRANQLLDETAGQR